MNKGVLGMKKIFYFITLCLFAFALSACGVEENKDALRFKEEYESLNDTMNASNLKHRSVTISKDNPFVYQTAQEIVERIKNQETFYVYFGSKYCPWCRSVIEQAISSAKENHIDTIYYVEVWGNDHEEILRDTYTLNKKGKPVVQTEGKEGYQELLTYFDNVLSEYTLTDKNKKTVSTGEKRIYLPNFIYVENGKSIDLVEGQSKKQKDSREELTDEMIQEEKAIFDAFFHRN